MKLPGTRPARYWGIILVVAALALTYFAAAPSQPETSTQLSGLQADNLSILLIGDGALATQLVDRLEEAGGRVIRSPGIPEAADLGPEVVVVFGGEWFEQRVDDAELHEFLRLASPLDAGLVMADGTTSVFFEALDRAGLYGIPVTETGEVRNPAYFNPALAGFRMKEVGGHAGPSLLLSMGSSPGVLAESLVDWIHEWSDGALQSTASTSAPHLRYVCEYNYSPLLDSDPHGRLKVTAAVYKLREYGMPDYDWYVYQVGVRSVPGTVAYDSAWRNDHTWAHHQVPNAGTNRWLTHYNPSTASGTDTVYVHLIPTVGPANWSYSIDGVTVLDQSDYYHHRAYWLHDIDRSAPTARDTYLSMPGFVVKTRPGYPSFVDAWYQVRFARLLLWRRTSTAGPTPTLMLDAFGAGD